MKATLYDALGLPQAASDTEIRAALRALIRRYYTRARDGQGNVEEALRFVNYASRVLGNPEQRRLYDAEIGLSAEGLSEQEIVEVTSRGLAASSQKAAQSILPAADESARPPAESEPLPVPARPAHTGLAQTVGYFGRSRYAQIAIGLVVCAFLSVVLWLAVPTADLVLLAKDVLVTLTIVLVTMATIYALVYGLSWRQRTGVIRRIPPQTDLAVFNWRRERTLFLGGADPVEDASWVFQLRMAELERAQARRTSEPRPWRRLAARLFDYGLWGTLLGALMVWSRAEGWLSPALTTWLSHPLIAPVLITVSWIPIEALLGAYLRTTPGKWLFSIFLQFAISDAYAKRDHGTDLRRWLGRSIRVWARGMGFGVPLAAPFFMAWSAETLRRDQETAWDYAEDCLVTQGALAAVNGVTGVIALVAMTSLFAVSWLDPLADTALQVSDAVTELTDTTRTRGKSVTAVAGEGYEILKTRAGVIWARTVEAARPTPTTAEASPAPIAAARANAPPTVATTATSDVAAVIKRDRTLGWARSAGPRSLAAGDFVRASEACATWTSLENTSAEAWYCHGAALEGLGRYREAVVALKRASSLAPQDNSIRGALARSEDAMLAQFRSKYVPNADDTQ